MGRLETIRANASLTQIVQGQLLHVGLIILLVSGTQGLLHPDPDGATLLGLTSTGWAMCSVVLAVLHQVIVAAVFRLELYRGVMTRLFAERALGVWTAIFMPFLILRPLTLTTVGLLDGVAISRFGTLQFVVGAALLGIAVVGMHSVIKYFTIRRAVGADHFDNAVIAMPMVREGVFKYTSNAMYGIVFLGLWGIALMCNSWNALVVALFQHVYIWVHMHLTEAPDMARIYGPD